MSAPCRLSCPLVPTCSVVLRKRSLRSSMLLCSSSSSSSSCAMRASSRRFSSSSADLERQDLGQAVPASDPKLPASLLLGLWALPTAPSSGQVSSFTATRRLCQQGRWVQPAGADWQPRGTGAQARRGGRGQVLTHFPEALLAISSASSSRSCSACRRARSDAASSCQGSGQEALATSNPLQPSQSFWELQGSVVPPRALKG